LLASSFTAKWTRIASGSVSAIQQEKIQAQFTIAFSLPRQKVLKAL
jgi:hypothetical protein